MTLLNKASDGFHNVLIVMIRSLLERKKSKKDLFESCMVGGMKDDKLAQTFNRWNKLGLFNVGETGVVELKMHQKFLKSKQKGDAIIPAILRDIIFLKNNNENNFWRNENNGAADLTRALAWLMAQDIYSTELESNGLVRLSSNQFRGSDFDTITNTRDLPTLKEYARFLGFTVGLNGQMIDPTEALKQDFRYSFQKGEKLDAHSFIQKVSALCPIMDKGLYRKRIEERLNLDFWKKVDQGNRISSSLSFAIKRLSEMKVLKLEKLDDSASALQPTGAENENWGKPFTHIQYIGESLI